MIFSARTLNFFIPGIFFLSFFGLSGCSRKHCTKSPRTKTSNIIFRLKDKITGNDLLPNNGTIMPVPDSVKLKDLKTGVNYRLFTTKGIS